MVVLKCSVKKGITCYKILTESTANPNPVLYILYINACLKLGQFVLLEQVKLKLRITAVW